MSKLTFHNHYVTVIENNFDCYGVLAEDIIATKKLLDANIFEFTDEKQTQLAFFEELQEMIIDISNL